IRGLLIFTCTGVSFAHGSNDGQKGMGLIMLILIGTVPTAYALNRALPESRIAQFSANSAAAAKIVQQKAAGYNVLGNPRPAVTLYVARHQINEGTYPSLAALIQEHRQAGQRIWHAREDPCRSGRQHSQRYVSCLRSAALSDEG